MKKNIFISVLACVMLACLSCEDFLDRPPLNRDIQLIAQHCNPVMGRFSHISLLF